MPETTCRYAWKCIVTKSNRLIINQKEFYEQSDALLGSYLKDTPAHIEKYAEEISDAEKALHDGWTKAFDFDKSELEKGLSDSVIVQWQYYEQLGELAEKYYNTAGVSYGKFADEYEDITREIKEGQKKLWEDAFGELNTQLDDLQSACGAVKDAIEEYSENRNLSIDTVQKLIALEPQYLAMLFDENGQLQLNEEAYKKLARAKLEEMKADLAYRTLNIINGLESEAQAVETLTGRYAELRDTSLSAVEAMLQAAVAEAHSRGAKQGEAADMMMDAYRSQKKAIDMTDFSLPSLTGEKEKEEKEFLKTFDWIAALLEKISNKTSKLIDKIEKFYSWQKKNSMINRAVKAADKEISQNQLAYQAYMKKADRAGLSASYKNKVQNGDLSIEDITDENLSNKIDEYKEWYDKAQDCLETIEDLYDRQRDLIKQKLDNVLDYYKDMDSYLSSVTSKLESIISLNDSMGRRSSLTELVEQFASISERMNAAAAPKDMTEAGVTEFSLGDARSVAEAVARDKQKIIDRINAEIQNLSPQQSGTYTKLLKDIAKTQTEIDRYESKGWDASKARAYDSLKKKLQDYYDLQNELDAYATSNTIGNYQRVFEARQKLQAKIDSGKALSKSEQKKYDDYTGQIEKLKKQGADAIDALQTKLGEADGVIRQTEADRIKDEISEMQPKLENTAAYKNLIAEIEKAKSKLVQLDEKGYDNLTKGQKRTYDALQAQIEAYYEKKQALDENATASNISEYNKIYDAWKKLQAKLIKGGNLSTGEWKKYNQYAKQLESFMADKADTIAKLNKQLNEALNPGDKLSQITKTHEEAAEDMYKSYQSQISKIKGEAESTLQYQNLLANAQGLEQKKKTKGLSKSEQAALDKYNAELEALRKGATGANIADYMKKWEALYALQLKLDSGKKLSAGEVQKYDAYKAELEAWNKEKQAQIDDLTRRMEEDLQQLNKAYEENMSGAGKDANDYYAELYSLAKQIAGFNITALQTQLDLIESGVSYYKELLSLYDSFSGDKLSKILTDLDEDALQSRTDIYENYLNTLNSKYDAALSEINEYKQLLAGLDTSDFEGSMALFNKAMEDYRAKGSNAMADKLQSVLNLLNKRAADAGNWGDYADEWAIEWEKALSSAKQELIGTASEIQSVNDALREIRFENITNAVDELEKSKNLLSSIMGLIQDGWLFEPDGSLSEYGRAKSALLASQLEDAQAMANKYLDLYNEIANNRNTYASDKDYMNARNEALQNYYDSLGNAASLENSIVELMKKNDEAEIDSLKRLIEERKKALQAKKEYYDYDKSLKNSQREIDSLKAQIDALEAVGGATDAAAKAKLAQLKADLKDKEDALQETKDEHAFQLQMDALDKFADTLADAIDSSTKSVEEILKEQKEIVESAKDLYRASTGSVNETLGGLEAFYGGTGAASPVKIVEPAAGYNEDMQKLIELSQAALDKGILLALPDSYALGASSAFNSMQRYMPPMINAAPAIPDYARSINGIDAQPSINLYYDNLINVEGSIDKDFAKVFPNYLKEACEYTKRDIYNAQRRLR